MSDTDYGVVLLAAGQGRRFGADKRFARLGAQSVAETTLSRYLHVFERIAIVVRPEDHALRELLVGPKVEFVEAPDAGLGMGHSLSAAFVNMSWEYAFVALMDMPYVEEATLRQLIASARAHAWRKIIRPQLCNGPGGHPIGWPSHYFGPISRSRGDQGARELLKSEAANTVWVNVEDNGIIKDIDRPGDLTEQHET